jgi:hypothetical protein
MLSTVPDGPFGTRSEFIETEMRLYSAILLKAERCKAILNKTRNSLPSLVPISSLPNEVLCRIFRFVMDEHPVNVEGLVDCYESPINSLAISHVCSHWRQVALGWRNLWTDIGVFVKKYNNLVELGNIFAERSADLPLNIRIIEPFRGSRVASGPFTSFFSRIAPRVATFEFKMLPPLRGDLSSYQLSILETNFAEWKPGQCTRLTIIDRNIMTTSDLKDKYFNTSAHWFLLPRDTTVPMNIYGRPARLNIDREHFEDILAQITILELNSVIYPYWTSKAYHGLVELSLMGPRRITTIITISQLADILTSSPSLRTLYFGLEVSVTGVTPQSVHLADLETFLLHSLHHDTQQAVLKLINPGRKPLQVSMTYDERKHRFLPANFEDEFRRFFRRSNIVELEIQGCEPDIKMPELLELLPNLEALIIHSSHLEHVRLSNEESLSGVLFLKLHILRLRYCTFPLATFQWMANACSFQKVSLLHCSILPETGIPFHRAEKHASTLERICPFIQWPDHMGIDVDGIEERTPPDVIYRIPAASLTDYRLY